mgnify:FL=1
MIIKHLKNEDIDIYRMEEQTLTVDVNVQEVNVQDASVQKDKKKEH